MSTTENDVIKIAEICKTPVEIETPCFICREGVSTWFGDFGPKVCKKCKDAVMAMRMKMEEQNVQR